MIILHCISSFFDPSYSLKSLIIEQTLIKLRSKNAHNNHYIIFFIRPSRLWQFRGLVSSTLTSCTLDDGTTTTCHELSFNANRVRNGNALINDELGPFCPSGVTTTDGGVGVYDGNSGPGFQNLNQRLWNNMVADGFDIINESNNTVCIQDPGAGNDPALAAFCDAYCLEASADDSLIITFLIPVSPVNNGSITTVGTVEPVGVSLDGVPITGSPPSVVNFGNGNIPSIDHCGGHHDPSGYYHWHAIAESADAMHEANGTSGQADCSARITQNSTALGGYARDGYPIYGYQDNINGTVSTPNNLDSCSGHTGATTDFPEGIYHYHASLDAPNLPTCITGASVNQRQSPTIR